MHPLTFFMGLTSKIFKEFENLPEPRSLSFIKVRTFYQDMKDSLFLHILNGDYSFERKIREKEINRPGLALGGFVEVFTYWRIQIMGNTEVGFLNTLHGQKRYSSIATVLGFDLPCILVTNNNQLPKEFVDIANKNGITIFITPMNTTEAHRHISEYLEAKFAPHIVIHGTLVDIFSVGVLFIGAAGIGKSELCLDLVERGHQLVADDVVEITRTRLNQLRGASRQNNRYHMEIRGMGIIDVFKMFGVRGIRGNKDIHVVVKLEMFSKTKKYERLGLDEKVTKIMGVEIPLVEIPIVEGKNVRIVAEAIALDHKLKQIGIHQAAEFQKELIERLRKKQKSDVELPIEDNE